MSTGDLSIISLINAPKKEKQDTYDSIFNRAYNLAAKHMLQDVISYLEDTTDIENLDYLREQLKKIPEE